MNGRKTFRSTISPVFKKVGATQRWKVQGFPVGIHYIMRLMRRVP